MKTQPLSKVSRDYEAGKWVPSYYGLRYVVGKKTPGPKSGLDTSTKYETLAGARAEANRRNRSK